jgi:maltose alpha-D-glucosyltransferase/alpha-amylase
MAGRSRFPTIGESPYTVTLGPYGFAWFLLEPQDAAVDTAPSGLPVVTAPGGWASLTQDSRARASLEAALPDVLAHRRWFAGKARTVSAVQVAEAVPIPMGPAPRRPAAARRGALTEGEPGHT